MKRLIPVVILSLAIGCVGPGKLTPQAGEKAINAATVAQGFLKVVNAGLYATFMALKEKGFISGDEKLIVQATRQLSGLDSAVEVLKAAIAGLTVTNAELNAAAAKVDGAKAVLEQVEKNI